MAAERRPVPTAPALGAPRQPSAGLLLAGTQGPDADGPALRGPPGGSCLPLAAPAGPAPADVRVALEPSIRQNTGRVP